MSDPKPPKPPPQSDPTVRTAAPRPQPESSRKTFRAATDHVEAPPRPPMHSDPAMRASRDMDMLRDEVRRLNEWKAEQASFNKALARHNDEVAAAVNEVREENAVQSAALLAVTDALRVTPPKPGQSGRPSSSAKPKPTAIDKIERDSWAAKVLVVLTLLLQLALWAANHIGGKP